MHSLLPRRYFVYPRLVNIAKSYDGLPGLIRNELDGVDPKNGDAYIFFNKKKTQVKILYWDGNGYAITGKRIEWGVFQVPAGRPDDQGYYISTEQVLHLIRGLQLPYTFKNKSFQNTINRSQSSIYSPN
jgi:transposase